MLIDYKKSSDAQLVQAYQKGDEEAGNVLCQRYWNALYRFFKKRIRKKEDVEDLVQETFLEALKTLRETRFRRSFQAWLYTIAKRVVGRWVRAQQRLFVLLDEDPENKSGQMLLEEALLAPITTQPEHGTIDDEIGDIRRRFERTLSSKESVVFRLRQNKNMTFKEIGQELNIKPNTAKVRYHRVVTSFKAWLEKHYPDIYYSFIKEGE